MYKDKLFESVDTTAVNVSCLSFLKKKIEVLKFECEVVLPQ